MERPKPLRGEVWMFDLNPKKGREQNRRVEFKILLRDGKPTGALPGRLLRGPLASS